MPRQEAALSKVRWPSKTFFTAITRSKIKYSSSANCKENGFANWLSGGFQGRTYANKPHPLRIHKVNHRRDDNRAIIYTCKIRCGSERKPVSSPPARLLRESKTAFIVLVRLAQRSIMLAEQYRWLTPEPPSENQMVQQSKYVILVGRSKSV